MLSASSPLDNTKEKPVNGTSSSARTLTTLLTSIHNIHPAAVLPKAVEEYKSNENNNDDTNLVMSPKAPRSPLSTAMNNATEVALPFDLCPADPFLQIPIVDSKVKGFAKGVVANPTYKAISAEDRAALEKNLAPEISSQHFLVETVDVMSMSEGPFILHYKNPLPRIMKELLKQASVSNGIHVQIPEIALTNIDYNAAEMSAKDKESFNKILDVSRRHTHMDGNPRTINYKDSKVFIAVCPAFTGVPSGKELENIVNFYQKRGVLLENIYIYVAEYRPSSTSTKEELKNDGRFYYRNWLDSNAQLLSTLKVITREDFLKNDSPFKKMRDKAIASVTEILSKVTVLGKHIINDAVKYIVTSVNKNKTSSNKLVTRSISNNSFSPPRKPMEEDAISTNAEWDLVLQKSAEAAIKYGKDKDRYKQEVNAYTQAYVSFRSSLVGNSIYKPADPLEDDRKSNSPPPTIIKRMSNGNGTTS